MSRRARLVLVLFAVLAGAIFVATAAAIRFTDDSYLFPEGVVDAPYSHTIEIAKGGGTAPYVYTILNGALPPGLSLNSSTGAITGKPTTAGTYAFTAQGADLCPATPGCAGAGQSKTQRDFAITVIPRLLVTDQVPPAGTVGVPYSMTLIAVTKSGPGATAPPSSPVTWTVLTGQLPPGLTLGGDGVISGTPTTAGAFTFTLKAALVDGRSDTKTQTITVRDAVKVGSTGVAGRSEVGVPFDADLTATGGTGTFTWSLTAGSLPKGVTLAADGSVSGTPHESGRFPFTATVTDTESRTATVAGVLAVAPRLTVTTKLLRLGKVGKLYRAKLVATGGIIPKIWKVTQGPLPRGVRLDRKMGIISGTPRKAGIYRITVQATDGFKVVATRTLRLTVVG
jgi:hypothetical protein